MRRTRASRRLLHGRSRRSPLRARNQETGKWDFEETKQQETVENESTQTAKNQAQNSSLTNLESPLEATPKPSSTLPGSGMRRETGPKTGPTDSLGRPLNTDFGFNQFDEFGNSLGGKLNEAGQQDVVAPKVEAPLSGFEQFKQKFG